MEKGSTGQEDAIVERVLRSRCEDEDHWTLARELYERDKYQEILDKRNRVASPFLWISLLAWLLIPLLIELMLISLSPLITKRIMLAITGLHVGIVVATSMSANSSRMFKYDLTGVGIALLWNTLTMGDYFIESVGIGVSGVGLAILLHSHPYERPSTIDRHIYKAMRKLDIFIILLVSAGMYTLTTPITEPRFRFLALMMASLLSWVALYIAGRAMITDKVARAPIVFLRSFHDENAARQLGQIIMPLASIRGVISVLTHRMQDPGALLGELNMKDIPGFIMIPDLPGDSGEIQGWQKWIQEEIACACAVIIDLSMPSEGVVWELTCAFTYAPRRTLILVSSDAAENIKEFLSKLRKESADIPPIQIVVYNLNDIGSNKAAIKSIGNWLDAICFPKK
ncbi:MAG: hypothetical protein MJE77_22265 [Proteobacteria bacterium]|nr:hypothetical protein [Pseudomonadota bacterium]